MADRDDPGMHRPRYRVDRSAVPHLLAMVIFALLAWSGAGMLRQGVDGLAVPSLMIGAAGAAGALLTVTGTPSRHPGPRSHRLVRGAMVLVAVAALVTGAALAPSGIDRGFVISVDAVLSGALASYALLAGERHRTARLPG